MFCVLLTGLGVPRYLFHTASLILDICVPDTFRFRLHLHQLPTLVPEALILEP